jgi:hypothetical protein
VYSTDGLAGVLKQFKQLRDISSKMITLGCVQHMRQLLASTVREVTQARSFHTDGYMCYIHHQAQTEHGNKSQVQSLYRIAATLGRGLEMDISMRTTVQKLYGKSVASCIRSLF